VSQPAKNDFKWRRYQGQLILLSVRWYLTYTLSYRQLERMLREQGWSVDHTSLFRWVQRYGPELAQRCRAFLKPTNRSYRVDETYIKVKGKDRYLYRAVDSTGQTIDFWLTAKRDKASAKRFFQKALRGSVNVRPPGDQRGQEPGLSGGLPGVKGGRSAAAPLSSTPVQIFE
jgi:transposase, IS6 family